MQETERERLIKKWRAEARYLAKEIRDGNYTSQTGRVVYSQRINILRACAGELKRAK